MKDIDVAVIGGGISGLSAALELQGQGRSVVVLESRDSCGGLIKCDRVEGVLFHRVGGHVFNSKNAEVTKWFWNKFDRDSEFIEAKRNAKVLLNGTIFDYPIENSIFKFSSAIVERIVNDLLEAHHASGSDISVPNNFQDFLLGNFGKTLYELYFRPYNEKIWQTDLSQVPLDWLEGKLPMPNYVEMLVSNILRRSETDMVHSRFFYPKSGGSQFIVDRLSESLEIELNTEVHSIERVGSSWCLNGNLTCQNVVYTGDIRRLATLMRGVSEQTRLALNDVSNLISRGTSNLLCETEPNDYSWLYLPDSNVKAHRVIYTGNFSATNNASEDQRTCTMEFSGEVSVELMMEEARKVPGIRRVIAHNYEPNSYVVQLPSTRAKVAQIRTHLEPVGFFLSGRFAEWEYHNMDKAIESALAKVNQILGYST